MKKKLLIPILIISSLFIISIIISIIILNKRPKEGFIYIYQYEVENYHFNRQVEPTLLYKIEFKSDTSFKETITSLDGDYYNEVIIEEGICYVRDANCLNHICMRQIIELNKLITSYSISCMPSGLYIVYK